MGRNLLQYAHWEQHLECASEHPRKANVYSSTDANTLHYSSLDLNLACVTSRAGKVLPFIGVTDNGLCNLLICKCSTLKPFKCMAESFLSTLAFKQKNKWSLEGRQIPCVAEKNAANQQQDLYNESASLKNCSSLTEYRKHVKPVHGQIFRPKVTLHTVLVTLSL